MEKVHIVTGNEAALEQVILNSVGHVVFNLLPMKEIVDFIEKVLDKKKKSRKPGESLESGLIWFILPVDSDADLSNRLDVLLGCRRLQARQTSGCCGFSSELAETDCLLIQSG
jgi:hypothetical protein